MKKIINYAILVAILAVGLVSCNKHSIRGDGSSIIETRNIGSFSTVKTNADIKVFISYGPTQKVEVKGYANLVQITETNLSNNALTIKYKDDYYNVRNSNVEVYITLPVLAGINTNGSGNVAANGFMNGIGLDIYINGSSDISISNSNYSNTKFDINGSGDIKASGLLTKNAEAIIHGSGDIEISCSQNLKVRISGSGDVRYWGNPSLDVQISGSGTVQRQ